VERLYAYRDLTINGVTVSPMYAFRGGDATLTQWVCAQTGTVLSIAGAGADPTINGYGPCLGDRSVVFNGGYATGKYFQAASADIFNVATEDIGLEGVFWLNSSTASQTHYNKRSLTVGMQIYNTAAAMSFYFQDAAAHNVALTWNFTGGVINHFMLFWNRDENSVNGMRLYVNGVISPDIGSANGFTVENISSLADKFTLGARSDGGGTRSISSLAWLTEWKCSNWFQAGAAGPAEWAIIARQRMALWTGNQALYQALGTTTPSSL